MLVNNALYTNKLITLNVSGFCFRREKDMSKKYEGLAKEIATKIGGSGNVSTLAHCQTRLRFVLKDESKADKEGVKKLDGVANVIESGGQFQIVIGTHVEEVYEEVIKYVSPSEDVQDVQSDDRNSLNKLIDFISATFSPIIPAISGAGMVKALLAILVLFNIVSNESQTYFVINFMADAVFYFLPVLLAFTAATKLKCSPYLAVALAGILLHPSFSTLVAAGEPVHVFGIPMRLVPYGASVVPILLIIFIQSYVENFMKKITPNSVKIIFVPMVTIFVTGLLGLLILGPIGSYVGEYLAIAFETLQTKGSWITPTLVGATFPLMVMFGLHHSVAPLGTMQVATLGYEGIWGPGVIVSNIVVGVAVLVASFRTKDKISRQVASANGVTALMGITEPALYGTVLPKKYPLIGALIGGGAGGFYAGITGTVRFATGSSGLPAIPLYIGEDFRHVINIVISLVIGSVVTAVVTYFLSFKFEKEEVVEVAEEKIVVLEDTFVTSPLNGEIMPLSNVKDEAFSSEALGKGFAVEPIDGRVVAPFDGEVVAVFPSKHAIGLVSNKGAEVLIHIGIDTVNLNGEHFEVFVEAGQPVKKGQLLVEFELDKLKEKGFVTQVPVVVTNTPQYASFELTKTGVVKIEENVLKINV